MLNSVWSSLVNEVEVIKKHYKDLEGNTIQATEGLNDRINTLIKRAKELEKKFWAIDCCCDDPHNSFTKQQQTIHLDDGMTGWKDWKLKRCCKIKFIWTLSHEDIEGNEMADEEAKLVTENRSSPRASLPTWL